MAKSLDIIDPKKEIKKTEEEDTELDQGIDDFEVEKKHSDGLFYLIIGIFAIVIATGTALYILYKDYSGKKDEDVRITQTASSGTSTTTASTSTAQSTQTPAAEVSLVSSEAASTFKYADQNVRIANGNGINGEASKIKKIIEDGGIAVSSTGNASRTYESSIIYYKSGQEALANALKSLIEKSYNAEIKESDQTVGAYDAVVVLGKQ